MISFEMSNRLTCIDALNTEASSPGRHVYLREQNKGVLNTNTWQCLLTLKFSTPRKLYTCSVVCIHTHDIMHGCTLIMCLVLLNPLPNLTTCCKPLYDSAIRDPYLSPVLFMHVGDPLLMTRLLLISQTNLVVLFVFNGVWTMPYHPLESLHIVHHGCPEQCSATLRKQKGEGRQVFHKEEYIYVHIKLHSAVH